MKKTRSSHEQSPEFTAFDLFLIDDEFSLVLKAHLFIESLLYKIIDISLPNVSALEGARLSFFQLISVVEALRHEKREQWIWESLRKLNALRNEYAHNLNPDNLEKKRKEFIESTQPWISPPDEEMGLSRFKYIINILCNQFEKISRGEKTAGPLSCNFFCLRLCMILELGIDKYKHLTKDEYISYANQIISESKHYQKIGDEIKLRE